MNNMPWIQYKVITVLRKNRNGKYRLYPMVYVSLLQVSRGRQTYKLAQQSASGAFTQEQIGAGENVILRRNNLPMYNSAFVLHTTCFWLVNLRLLLHIDKLKFRNITTR